MRPRKRLQAVTLPAAWAWAIIHLDCTIISRTWMLWTPPHRLAIHASGTVARRGNTRPASRAELELVAERARCVGWSAEVWPVAAGIAIRCRRDGKEVFGVAVHTGAPLPDGAHRILTSHIVAVCRPGPTMRGDADGWYQGYPLYGWTFRAVEKLEIPIPCYGLAKVWNLSMYARRLVEAQLRRAEI